MSGIMCPVCSGKLEMIGNSFVCESRHSFDIAKSGYVNLLIQKRNSTVHGDNKFMLKARREFLEKGYYSPLCNAVCDTVAKYAGDRCVILDAGCGEGYYTAAVKAKIDSSNIGVKMYGIDISKDAVDMASKRKCGVQFAVASVFGLPIMTESCDILLTMFAPFCAEEYGRVLKNGGIMIMAIPGENHLWEMKCKIYDTPYKNEVKPYELDGFEFISRENVRYTMDIPENGDIQSLFSMTPYYYKTGRNEQQKLASLTELSTQADFQILTYKKIGKD